MLWLALSLTLGSDPTDMTAVTPAAAQTSAVEPLRRSGQFYYFETGNFRIWCAGSESQTRQLGKACEGLRSQLRETWLDEIAAQRWTPACDIVVHPSVQEYVRQLGPGSAQTSGCSSIRLDSGRVVMRRIDLRADSPAWLNEALPHEMTHVVLADRFSHRQVSRWADEGMSILAESFAKQDVRAREFAGAMSHQQTFSVRDLLTLNGYPPVHLRGAFYGQSASLVRFLVERGTAEQFVDFVEMAMHDGYDAALRQIYHIDGAGQLEQLWRQHLVTDGERVASRPSILSRRVAAILSQPAS